MAELPEAEGRVRRAIAGRSHVGARTLDVVMAEYDRLKAVVCAASRDQDLDWLMAALSLAKSDSERAGEVLRLRAELARVVSVLANLVAWWDSPTFAGPDTAEGNAAWAEARRVLAELGTTTEEERTRSCRNCGGDDEVRLREFDNYDRPVALCGQCAGLLSQGDVEMYEARCHTAEENRP